MTNPELEPIAVTIPLTLSAHARATQFRQQHLQKSSQVYLNSLAVSAVEIYLQRLEFDTNFAASASANPLMRALMDVADLAIDHHGVLECRPVLPNARDVLIPAEVWSDRIGFVAVQLDSGLQTATLLGFVETVTTEKVALSELRSIEFLPSYLNSIRQKPASVHLTQWLQNQVDSTWQTIEELLGLQQPAWQYRGNQSASTQLISRGKLLDFDRSGEAIALVVEVAPKDALKVNIAVKLCPTGSRAHLPPDLELMVLDEAGIAVIQAQARTTEMINVEFSGEVGDRFSIKAVMNGISAIDQFVI
ncbi:DUF1822 family protein [Microcoleus sp. FACHB-1515]|uniref:DUF1822 family protein n=1 Tax=Cyanophyceae TaxID=3028117 RepID=UPI001684AE3E|nr:DUF1822 family protein [Microcoleus sp. FACHB-1515]MBD2092540.1 DUF1822 family protein [Microcoleus sp. FACHB-1515]